MSCWRTTATLPRRTLLSVVFTSMSMTSVRGRPARSMRERVRLKLLNPLGVGLSLVKKYGAMVSAELEVLAKDLDMLSGIERQLELFREDQARNFGYRLSDIDNALLDFESRGASFFEETVRLGRVFDLVNKAKVKSDFEKKVVGDLPRVLEKRVGDLIDWMIASELKQWQAVVEYLAERRSHHGAPVPAHAGRGFDQERSRLALLQAALPEVEERISV